GVTCDVSDNAHRAASDGLTTAGHTVKAAEARDRVRDEGGYLMAFNNAGIMIPPSDAADELADRSQAGRAIRPYRTALTALRDLGARNITRPLQATCRATPLASAINSSTDHWS